MVTREVTLTTGTISPQPQAQVELRASGGVVVFRGLAVRSAPAVALGSATQTFPRLRKGFREYVGLVHDSQQLDAYTAAYDELFGEFRGRDESLGYEPDDLPVS